MSFYDDLHQLAKRIPCDYCGAATGAWCVTKTGRRSSYLHSARSTLIFEANTAGYVQGVRDGLLEGAHVAGDRHAPGVEAELRRRATGWES